PLDHLVAGSRGAVLPLSAVRDPLPASALAAGRFRALDGRRTGPALRDAPADGGGALYHPALPARRVDDRCALRLAPADPGQPALADEPVLAPLRRPRPARRRQAPHPLEPPGPAGGQPLSLAVHLARRGVRGLPPPGGHRRDTGERSGLRADAEPVPA